MENDLSPWDHYKGNKGVTEDSMIHVVELVIMQKKKNTDFLFQNSKS